MSTKKAGWLIDYNGDQFIPMTSAFEIFNRHGARTFGNAEANDDNLGAQNQFIFINNGVFAPSTQSIGTDEKTLMYLNNGVFSRSTKSEGSKINPIYLSGGTLVASDETVGSATKLMYLSNGTFTESDGNVGSGTRPIYLSGGVLTACNTNIGANDNFIYIDSDGSLTPSTENKGGDYTPLYLRQGKLVAGNNLNYTLSLGDLSNNCIAFQLLRNGNIQTGLGFLGTTNIVLKKDSLGNVIEISAGYQEAEYQSGLQISVGFYDDEDLHVPYASDSQYGVVKTGYTTTGRNFAVQLSDGKMYVNVPSDNVDSYHTPTTPEVDLSNGLKIAVGTGVGDLYVPIWARTTVGYAPGLVPSPDDDQGSGHFLSADGQWRMPVMTPTIADQTSTPSSYVSLSHGSYYQLSVGDESIYFKMPSDSNNKVEQSTHSADDNEYPILTKWIHDASSGTKDKVGYTGMCTVNPDTGCITAELLHANDKITTIDVVATDTVAAKTLATENLSPSSGSNIYCGTSLIPDENLTYKLGNYDKYWQAAWIEDLNIYDADKSSYATLYCSGGILYCDWNLDVDGAVTANSFNAGSDIRLKENFRPFIHNDILDLPLYKFDYINGLKDRVGCIAQDLQKICPEIVHVDSNGYLSIEESKIVYLLLDKMKEMQKEIDELRGV